MVDALGGTAGTRFRLVVLPAAVPHIVSGARIAAGSAVIAAVVGESLIGRSGLGVQFSRAYRLLELPRAFGAAIVIVVVSVAVFAAAGWVERVVHAALDLTALPSRPNPATTRRPPPCRPAERS